MKTKLAALATLAALSVGASNITWIGFPMFSDDDPYTPSQFWTPGYKVGFRDDGVVVWKKSPKAESLASKLDLMFGQWNWETNELTLDFSLRPDFWFKTNVTGNIFN